MSTLETPTSVHWLSAGDTGDAASRPLAHDLVLTLTLQASVADAGRTWEPCHVLLRTCVHTLACRRQGLDPPCSKGKGEHWCSTRALPFETELGSKPARGVTSAKLPDINGTVIEKHLVLPCQPGRQLPQVGTLEHLFERREEDTGKACSTSATLS